LNSSIGTGQEKPKEKQKNGKEERVNPLSQGSKALLKGRSWYIQGIQMTSVGLAKGTV